LVAGLMIASPGGRGEVAPLSLWSGLIELHFLRTMWNATVTRLTYFIVNRPWD